MEPKLVLTSKAILDKVFGSAPRGYNPLEVDQFLDLIIKDYMTVENNALVLKSSIKDLNDEIKKLKEENYNLQVEIGKFKTRFSNIKDSDNVTSDNIELVKKINKYEKFLYNHGYNPNDI